MHVTDAGVLRDPADHAGDAMAVDRGNAVGEQAPGAGDVDGVGLLPVVDQRDQGRVERDVAVVAELADGDVQPVVVADFDDRIGGQVAELTDTHRGPCEQQDAELAERVGFDLGVVHERCHLGVVEELRQRLGAWWDVTADDRVAAGCVVELPVDDPIEEHLEVTQPRPDRVDRQRLTGGVMGVGDQLELERFDVRTTDVGGASNR